MYKTFVFGTVIIAGVFLAPVATSAALAPPASHVVASAPPVQMFIVWSLLALIALTISYSVVHLLRRVDDDALALASN